MMIKFHQVKSMKNIRTDNRRHLEEVYNAYVFPLPSGQDCITQRVFKIEKGAIDARNKPVTPNKKALENALLVNSVFIYLLWGAENTSFFIKFQTKFKIF